MSAFICPNCKHRLRVDAETLRYLLNHPPKCVNCGHEYERGDNLKDLQWTQQLLAKGYRRTCKLYQNVYHSGKENADSYLKDLIQKKRLSIKTGTKKLTFSILLWVIISASVAFGFIPMLTELFDKQKPNCLDLIYVPDKDGGKVWGLYGTGYESNEIRVYITDPISGEEIIEKDIETEYAIVSGNLVQLGQTVWLLGNNYSYQPHFYILNAKNAEIIMNANDFIIQDGHLKSALTEIQYYPPYIVEFTGKSGDHTFYHFKYDKFFNDYQKCSSYDDSLREKPTYYFELQRPKNQSPHIKKLFLVHPESMEPEAIVMSDTIRHNISFYLSERENNRKDPVCEKTFLDGEIVYSDNELAVIKHLNELGTNSRVILSGIDKDGRVLFEFGQSDLLKIDTEDFEATATRFERFPGMMVVTFSYYGICGIDLKTGNLLWAVVTGD